jgi:murein DD-endopeptidase MepM/ murein hydrolase activator NlpD
MILPKDTLSCIMSFVPHSLSLPLQLRIHNQYPSFVFHPGMLFDSREKWWSQGKRASSHEGIDLCLIHQPNHNPTPLSAGLPVLSPAPGVVAAIIDDFLGQTVIISHRPACDTHPEWVSLLAHIHPCPELRKGQLIEAGQPVGWTKSFPRPRGMLCHLHLSVGVLLQPKNYTLTWPELIKRDLVDFKDPLPLLASPWEIWHDLSNWFAFLSQCINNDT